MKESNKRRVDEKVKSMIRIVGLKISTSHSTQTFCQAYYFPPLSLGARYELALFHHVIQQQLSITQQISSSSVGDGRVDSKHGEVIQMRRGRCQGHGRCCISKWGSKVRGNSSEWCRIFSHSARDREAANVPNDTRHATGFWSATWTGVQDRPSTDQPTRSLHVNRVCLVQIAVDEWTVAGRVDCGILCRVKSSHKMYTLNLNSSWVTMEVRSKK